MPARLPSCRLAGEPALGLFPGSKVKSRPAAGGGFQRRSRYSSKGDEAREVLANTLLNHVPVIRYNFQAKVTSNLQQHAPASQGFTSASSPHSRSLCCSSVHCTSSNIHI